MHNLIVGCGKMGGALLESWNSGEDSFTIVDPALKNSPDGVELYDSCDKLGERKFDVIIVAIKPQMIDKVIPDYAERFSENGYLLSIAAGSSIDRLKAVSAGQPVVRVMPNLPAAIGKGVSGMCASQDVSNNQVVHARKLMERAGSVIMVDDEDALDRVTAVAGSGPGYVFEIARAYVEAAKALGFSPERARTMALETMSGTIEMALDSDMPLASLRDNVTSKGGTTAAGLAALNGDKQLDRLFQQTLRAAYERAVELR